MRLWFTRLGESRLPVKLLVLFTLVSASGISAPARDVSLTALELYDGANGAAYVYVAGLLINGKAEMRECGPESKIDKSAYSKLPKVMLDSATSLERQRDGALMLTRAAGTICVVPSNLKLDKDVPLTRSQLADRASLQGKVLSTATPTSDTPPPLKPGVKLVFVAAPDVELAEYLRADYANSIQLWQDYLGRYPSSTHSSQAKQSLALLLTNEGDVALAAYRKTAAGATPSYADLKTAKLRTDQSLDLVAKFAPGVKLEAEVRDELSAIAQSASQEFAAYEQALRDHTAGYVHLSNARKLVDQVFAVDSHFDPASQLRSQVMARTQAIQSSLDKAESMAGSQHVDEAMNAIAPYLSFAGEESRIANVIATAYKFHMDRGTAFVNDAKWQDAVREFQQASDIKQTPEATASLQKAGAGLLTFQARTAADAALRQSQDFEEQKDNIQAYEVLAALPKAARALVSERMETLEPTYIISASARARELQEAHTPIRGKADEVAVLQAYDYLQRISGLSDDLNLKLRFDLLAETISDYYLQQAKKYLEKPLGSGVGLGWLYLDQAQLYKPNREDVHDERTKSAAIYQLRSKLSVRVVFRDQTSRRDSAGFAEQLSDAIATGLETSGLPVRVIRPNDATAADPNFQLIGDVLQHRPIMNPTIEPMPSHYRFGEREIPNEDWTKADRDYEAAGLDLQSAQKLMEGAQARGKKKEIADATAKVEAAQKKVEDLHRTLDSIQKTLPTDIIKPYTYTRKTFDLAAVVELAFRIIDSSGASIQAATPVTKQASQKFVVTQNVKPEDTDGVKEEGSPPDETQFMNDVEIEARDTLIKTAREAVASLPSKILEQARSRASHGDFDGAAENYILYLNATKDVQSSEREEAQRFLKQQFNIRQISLSGGS